jgi:hypothetical protein
MDNGDRLIELVSLVYDTIERPNSWNPLLEGFAEAVGGVATSLILYTLRFAFAHPRTGACGTRTVRRPSAANLRILRGLLSTA